MTGGQLRGIEGLYSPLVGRVQEMTELKQILSHFYDGQGRVISVTGDAGLGKTRLIDELNRRCVRDGRAQWVDGRAVSFGEEASYLITRDLLRNMLGLDLDSPAEIEEATLRAAVDQLLPDQFAETYPYLAHLLDIPLDEASAQRIKYLEGDALHQRILQAVQTFVAVTSHQKPLVMVWEDLHWADPSSLHLLESLLPLTQSHALLLFLIYRPPVRDSRMAQFQQRMVEALGETSLVMQLGPLSQAESSQLLDNLLGPDTLPENIKQLIIAKAEGNPFYLEEVIRSLINSDTITQAEDGQSWRVKAGIDTITLPDTLQGVIMSRIDQLDPDTKRVLQVASVVGRRFSYQVLTQIVDNLNITH